MEQGLPDASCVIYRVVTSDYKHLYNKVWGELRVKWPENICSAVATLPLDDHNKVSEAYDNIARSIAAYERSKEVSTFTSKYDDSLKGKAKLTEQEIRGLELFNNKSKGKCSNCHVPPLFTDFTYDNLGIPKNPMNPFYHEQMWNGLGGGLNWIDSGLGGFLKTTQYSSSAADNNGKHKVPTLRNVDKRPYPEFIKAYGHNGYFKSLNQIVHFYNTRDVLGSCTSAQDQLPGKNCWPAPEVSANVNTAEMGNLGLSVTEEEDIVAFLKTLTDMDDQDHGKDRHEK
jgi:cytochrome c peroxidase